MKKVLFVFALFMVTLAGNASAQAAGGYEHILLNSIRLKEGANSISLPNGRGTLRFFKRGTTFSNVLLVNSAGQLERLTPNDGAEGAPNPVCQCPMPDACFATENKNVGMCMCNPCDKTMPDDQYTIALLLPAIQKVREAAARAK